MKTITIILASILSILSQTGFADSHDFSGSCCPVSSEATINVYQKQQLLLDQLQSESQTINVATGTAVHELVQKKVNSKNQEQTSMSNIQLETENVHMESLHSLSQKVNQHVTREASTSSK